MNTCLYCGNDTGSKRRKFCNDNHYSQYFYQKKKGLSDDEILKIGSKSLPGKHRCLFCDKSLKGQPLQKDFCDRKCWGNHRYYKDRGHSQEEILAIGIEQRKKGKPTKCRLCDKDIQYKGVGKPRLDCSPEHGKFYRFHKNKGLSHRQIRALFRKNETK